MRASAGSGRGALVAADDIAVGQRDRRMAREDAHQLLPGIAGGAGNGDAGEPGRRGRRSDLTRAGLLWPFCRPTIAKEYLYIPMYNQSSFRVCWWDGLCMTDRA